MFEIKKSTPFADSVFKNKKTGLLYLKLRQDAEYLDQNVYVNLSDKYEYTIPDEDMELWVYVIQKG